MLPSVGEIEAAFKNLKGDHAILPIFHPKRARIEAHIVVCFLALALWRTLDQWIASNALGTRARQLLKELEELHSMDVVLPTATGVKLWLRVVAQPETRWRNCWRTWVWPCRNNPRFCRMQ